MPLFARKKRYTEGDLVVVSQISLLEFSSRFSYLNRLNLFVGHYEPLREYKTNRKLPAFVPYWQLCCYLNSSFSFYDVYDTAEFILEDHRETIEGVVVGRLNVNDRYDVRSYLKLCAKRLTPYYRDQVFSHAVSRIG